MDKGTDKMAVNWTQVNVPTIVTVLGVAWGVVQYINDFDKRLTESESYRVMRSAQTDQNFLSVNKSISELKSENTATREMVNDVPYRIGNLEKGQLEQANRVDRLSEIIIQSNEGLRKDIGVLGTKIEVLTSRIDNSMPPRRTQLLLRPQSARLPQVH